MSVTPYNNGNFPTYRFYLTWHTITYEVFPRGFNETTLLDELESGQVFYRRKFQGKLTFGGNDKVLDVSGVEQNRQDDFTLLWLIETTDPCDRLDFTITKTVAGVVTTYWEGYFSSSLCDWDVDRCICTVTPLLSDDYNEILDEQNTEYNILAAGEITEVTTSYSKGVDILVDYTHNRWLIDVIEYLADKMIPGITVSSTFFSNAINPISLTTNKYKYLTIAHKSDIKWPASLNPVTVGMMSFYQIIEMIRCMNLYWDYDGTTLRVEHVSFWTQSDGEDIRTNLTTQSTNKYRWLNETMPKYEMFSWMEAGHPEFLGYPIWYDSVCVNQDSSNNTTEYSFGNLTTDIDYIRECVADTDSESLISDDGWVILANEKIGADYYVYFNTGILEPTTLYGNADMGWAYLDELFWKHKRPLIRGYMNNVLKDFLSDRKNRQQECSIILCNEFDPAEGIITELGMTYLGGARGTVGSASLKPSGEIKLKLLYGDTENANPGYDYPKFVRVWEENTGPTQSTFDPLASEVADVDINYVFVVRITDADMNTCSSGNLTITILTGGTTGTLVYNWCDPGGAIPFCLDWTACTSVTAPWINAFLNISVASSC